MRKVLSMIAIASLCVIANGETVKMATEAFVTNYVYKTVTNYVESAAPKKKIAMFIIPLNSPVLEPETSGYNFFDGFELKASTNNFRTASQDSSSIQFYSDSGIADGYGSSISGFTGDRMKLFVCDYTNPEFRSYNYITNTSVCGLFEKHLESLIAIVDVSCLRRNPSGEWLSEDNENLSWCFTRTEPHEGMDSTIEWYSYEGGIGQYWHPIVPVRWFSKMPEWAVVPW